MVGVLKTEEARGEGSKWKGLALEAKSSPIRFSCRRTMGPGPRGGHTLSVCGFSPRRGAAQRKDFFCFFVFLFFLGRLARRLVLLSSIGAVQEMAGSRAPCSEGGDPRWDEASLWGSAMSSRHGTPTVGEEENDRLVRGGGEYYE